MVRKVARIRSVKPGLFGSYNLAKVPVEARYLFVGLFCEADDDGRMIDSPKRLTGIVFPHDVRVTERKVSGWLDQLEGIGSIIRYEVKGTKCILIRGWLNHQRISHPYPSPLPAPSASVLESFDKKHAGDPA